MSLNGLDAPAVKEAHEAAASEPGGWFLLKYASRDEVDILGQGTGGIVEIRDAISQYEEPSPLYGFLKYRRRNVLIKYLPESCSRLIQARSVVHFNAVSEKLVPYNTTFDISTAKELKDTKLSAACSLHTASSSTSSSTSSLRRRRLIEIAEEEEEEQQAAKRQSILKEEDHPTPPSPVVLNSELASSPEASKFSSTTEPPPFLGVDQPPSPSRSDDAGHLSAQLSQLSNAELLSYAYPYGKPKVKIGPRPSVDTSGRPRTSGSAGNCRPISSIPAGFKLLSKGSKKGRDNAVAESSNPLREETPSDLSATADDGDMLGAAAYSTGPTNTSDLKRPHTSSGRPTTSSGLSTKSTATTVTVSETKRNPITPEMARLKKALKLREMKMHGHPPLPSPSIDAPAMHLDSGSSQPVDESADTTSAMSGEQSLVDRFPLPDTNSADSAIDVGLFAVDHASVDTQTTDSHPASPLEMPSEVGDSTKASSLSESTDETVCTKSTDQKPDASVVSDEIPLIAEPNMNESTSTGDLDNSGVPSTDAKQAKRKVMVDPIRTDLGHDLGKTATQKEADLLDDEDFMEELQSATVEEAMPVTVSKSPATPVFPNMGPLKPMSRPGTSDTVNHLGRAASNPVRASYLAPGDGTTGSARSASFGAAFMDKIAQQTAANNMPKKATNVGSSISQRIKALEKLTENGRAVTPESSTRLERPSSTFFAVRKPSVRESSRSPSVAEHASSQKADKALSPPSSQESSPEVPRLAARERSGSVASRLSVFEGGNVPRGRPESIQVRARILRDPGQSSAMSPEARGDGSDFSLLDLKQSPLVVDHQKADGFRPSHDKRKSIQERRRSKERRRSQSQDRSVASDTDEAEGSRRRRRSSLSMMKDFIKERRGSVRGGRSPSTDNAHGPAASASPSRPPSVHTTASLSRRLSISSRRSSISKDRDANTPLTAPLSPSLMSETGDSGDEGRPSKSRAGRFMKRLSSSFSSGRKATTPTLSPTVAEEEEVLNAIPAADESAATQQPSIVSLMGDVNVQFPDNLLWKRRTMSLDSQGFLILCTVNGVPTGAVKRYHLSEFRLPYIPEMEVQELPNSVCLDFVDGSGLQIACEDRTGQTSVLQILQAAHQSHTQFGQ
ncbi:GPI-anchored cell surface protein [Grosmannia clavigera kw1407]|uniref:GPI-anchored cell surface protein n=1 Tax=Grosmannia clavigera (strain kw1407 / UAMH 11150) TaxID=655863 RepID=F0XHK4_GROCL|nr:GPI-anchored cell surface protein [Grosmannia clavigera kw1407]EFX02906.1 GPI-anchored cell surface protein [Grosmannia clavigera kw1407]